MSRLTWTLCALVLLAACSADSATSVKGRFPTGDFVLRAVNGAPLPFALDRYGNATQWLMVDTIGFNAAAEDRVSRVFVTRLASGANDPVAVVSPYFVGGVARFTGGDALVMSARAWEEAGAWTLRGDTLRFRGSIHTAVFVRIQ